MKEDGAITEDPDEIESVERQMPFIKELLSIYDEMRKVLTASDKNERFIKLLLSLDIEFFAAGDCEEFLKGVFKGKSQKAFILLLE